MTVFMEIVTGYGAKLTEKGIAELSKQMEVNLKEETDDILTITTSSYGEVSIVNTAFSDNRPADDSNIYVFSNPTITDVINCGAVSARPEGRKSALEKFLNSRGIDHDKVDNLCIVTNIPAHLL